MLNTENKNQININFISVVNNYEIYNKCVKENDFTKGDNIKLIAFNNIDSNIFIPKRYNSFLNSYDYSIPSWFVFCHQDWEIMEDITSKLENLDKNAFYGPIGTVAEIINGKCYNILVGSCLETKRDGTDLRRLGKMDTLLKKADTFDCQAFIVHSSLIEKYHLRFDENLEWDLYIEDMCISGKKNYSIDSYALNINCCHFSGYHELPNSYVKAIKYLNNKYPDSLYGGMVSIIGNKKIEIATYMETLALMARRSYKNNGA